MARRVEVVTDEAGYLLIRYGDGEEFAGDTWHATLDEAKGQARFEFGIESEEWAET